MRGLNGLEVFFYRNLNKVIERKDYPGAPVVCQDGCGSLNGPSA